MVSARELDALAIVEGYVSDFGAGFIAANVSVVTVGRHPRP